MHFDGTFISCVDCCAYAASNEVPNALRKFNCHQIGLWRKADPPKSVSGVKPKRPIEELRRSIKKHFSQEEGGDGHLHAWCVKHAAEQMRVAASHEEAGLNCAKVRAAFHTLAPSDTLVPHTPRRSAHTSPTPQALRLHSRPPIGIGAAGSPTS